MFADHQIWAMRPTALAEAMRFSRFLHARRSPGAQIGEPWTGSSSDDITVLQLFGGLLQRSNFLGTSLEDFSSRFVRAVNSPAVRALVLEVDSPGGSVFGVLEASKLVFDARGKKSIVAVINSLAESSAYVIASQADEVIITPSGMAGGLGVVAVHQDYSQADEKDGVLKTLITSSPFKGELDPSQPLSDGANGYLQSQVNAYHGMMTATVARGRGVTEYRVEKDFGGGRLLLAQDAKAAGMVDRVDTLQATLLRLSRDRSSPTTRAAAPSHRLVSESPPSAVAVAPSVLIEGYAALFNVRMTRRESRINQVETIDSGAFAEALQCGESIGLVVNHDMGRQLASTGDGSLRLWQDDRGLAFSARLRGAPADGIVSAYRAGRLLGCSLMPYVPSQKRGYFDAAGYRCFHRSFSRLVEVSLCIDELPLCRETKGYLRISNQEDRT